MCTACSIRRRGEAVKAGRGPTACRAVARGLQSARHASSEGTARQVVGAEGAEIGGNHGTGRQADARVAFTTQAASYAASAVVADRERRERFVNTIAPAPDARVLDVATGPGFTALAFAHRVKLVVGVDVTPAMLAQARRNSAREGTRALRLVVGDAARLPFHDGAFDVVTCGNAVHHFPAVAPVLRELRRVCRPGGIVAISDLVSAEDAEQAAEHNVIERLRDPSHVWSFAPSELALLLEREGFTLRSVTTTTARRNLGEWLAIARTPAEAAARVRRRLVEDRAGLAVAWEEIDGGRELCFTHTTAWLIAERAGAACV